MTDQTNNRLLLKNLLKGRVTPDQVRAELTKDQPPAYDSKLLTEPERELFLLLIERHKEGKKLLKPGEMPCDAFAGFNMKELEFFGLALRKMDPSYPKRHILDRVDLTTLSEDELYQAQVVFKHLHVKVFEDQLPEWLKGARA